MDRAAELAGRKGTMRTPREFFDLAETGELASNFSEKDLISYATACVAEALAPRDASPELAEAENWLRGMALSFGGRYDIRSPDGV